MRKSTFALLLPGLLFAALFAKVGQADPTVLTRRFTIAGMAGPEQAIAVWSPPRDSEQKLPIVIAFHGKGESTLGPKRGYAAWLERYGIDAAYAALLGGVLEPASFGGLVREAELAFKNRALAQRPFAGVLAIGLYTPDLLRAQPAELERYARWVAEQVVPEVRRSFPFASSVPRQVGVDGVSLGGMVALEVGLRFPEVFGAVGTMQPAIRGREVLLAKLADEARAREPQQLRLLSSDRDPLLPVTQALSRELRSRHIGHQLAVQPGGHDYAFNRGPAAIELLLFHDRALRDLPRR
jgi:dienelactone hydrolase